MAVTLMSRLDAVNRMLEAVWETPVSSLEVAGVGSVAMAKRVLNDVSTSVQNKGWTFNTEYGVTLAPDINGQINLPANTLEVDSDAEDASIDVVQRGTRLYNRTDHTFTFARAIKARLVFLLEFEDLTQVARTYIATMAARLFKAEYQNEAQGPATPEEARALSNLEESEAETGDNNMFNDSWSVASILDR